MMKLRPRLVRLIGSSIIVVVILPAVVSSASADGGVLQGHLRNGTAAANLPIGHEVTLLASLQGGSFNPVQTVRVDERGNFRFILDDTSHYAYVITTTYEDVVYSSPPVSFAGEDTTKPVELSVYETTESDTALRVEVGHVVLEPDPQSQSLCAIETAEIVNSADRTYVGDHQRLIDGKRVTLLFSWPEDSGQLQPMQGLHASSLVEVADGFWDTEPVLPGRHEVGYTYMVPIQNGSVNFGRVVDYPTDLFMALVVDTGERIDARALTEGDPMDMEGKRYQIFTGQDIAPRTTIRLHLRGCPR